MDSLKVYRGEQLVRQVVLGERPLELGTGAGCDVYVDDPELAERHWLAMHARGTILAYDVSGERCGEPRHLPLGKRVALGKHHSLERSSDSELRAVAHDTDRLELRQCLRESLQLVVGRGADARRILVRDRPLHVGRASGNQLVLSDNAVSARHCRIEPIQSGVLVRDLDSRNGTFLNGIRIERALATAGACLRVGRSELYLIEHDDQLRAGGSALVAEAPNMLALLADAKRIASLSWPVLVHGESGSGKEGIAELLHQQGARRGRPFITLNAGGVPPQLIESELFGHERGAFTGATQARRGVFEQADGGTLFLDEIGELPLPLQARLLRVLDSGEVRRVGAEGTRKVDVRLVCATHRDVRALVAQGGFRQDLYYRIARVVLNVPPLRARLQDVGVISQQMLRELAAHVGERTLGEDALRRMCAYDWPGNVRELRNVLSCAALASGTARIEAADIERALAQVGAMHVTKLSDEVLREALSRHAGNRAAAARSLGLPRSTLRDRMRTLGSTSAR